MAKNAPPPKYTAEQALMAAQTAINVGNFQLAARLSNQVATAVPGYAPARLAFGMAISRLGRYRQALRVFEACVQFFDKAQDEEDAQPRVAQSRKYNLLVSCIEAARAAAELSQFDLANTFLDKMTELSPESRTINSIRARVNVHQGNYKEAADLLTPHFKQGDTDVEVVLVALMIASQSPESIDINQTLEVALATSKRVGIPAAILSQLLHQAAKLLHTQGDHENAYSCFRRAATMGSAEFQRSMYVREVGTLINGWSTEKYQRIVRPKTDDQTPVILVGLPGPMITVAEQLISQHPAATTAGSTRFLEEATQVNFRGLDRGNFPILPRPGIIKGKELAEINARYSESLRYRSNATDQHTRVVDANSLNIMQLGLIGAMLPAARVIRVTDTPIAAAFNAWATVSVPDAPFISEMGDLAIFMAGERQLADHFRKTFNHQDSPLDWHDLNIQDLRSDPEATTKALFEFLDLDPAATLDRSATELIAEHIIDHEPYDSHLKSLRNAIDRAKLDGLTEAQEQAQAEEEDEQSKAETQQPADS